MFTSVKEIIPTSEFCFSNFLVGMCMLAGVVYVWCTAVCLYSQGGWSCRGEQRMQETQHPHLHPLKMHFHPAEGVPMSNGTHSGHPSLVSSQMNTVCSEIALQWKAKWSNAPESLFKSTLLSPAKMPAELGFSNSGRGLVTPRVVLGHLEKSIFQHW